MVTFIGYFYSIIVKQTLQITTPFKDDIRQLRRSKTANITKDDITLQHNAKMSQCCEVISSFVIFAVLDLRSWRMSSLKAL